MFSFFYTRVDNETIEYEQKITSIDWRFVKKSKERCKAECDELLFTFLEATFDVNDHFCIWISRSKFNNVSTPLLSSTDFWINFFALICLYFKLSLMSIIFRLKKALLGLENQMAISMLTILFWITLILSFFFGYYQSAFMYSNYANNTLQSFVYRVAPFKPASFNAAVCKVVDLKNLKNLSLFEIENETANFSLSIWLKFDEEETQIKTFVFKTFFRRTRKHLEQCLLFEVKIAELRYRSTLSMTSLLINGTGFSHVYLGAYKKKITPVATFFRRLEKLTRMESIDVIDCQDYRPHRHGCDSQNNCIGESN